MGTRPRFIPQGLGQHYSADDHSWREGRAPISSGDLRSPFSSAVISSTDNIDESDFAANSDRRSSYGSNPASELPADGDVTTVTTLTTLIKATGALERIPFGGAKAWCLTTLTTMTTVTTLLRLGSASVRGRVGRLRRSD
jgi:hypothetical protein